MFSRLEAQIFEPNIQFICDCLRIKHTNEIRRTDAFSDLLSVLVKLLSIYQHTVCRRSILLGRHSPVRSDHRHRSHFAAISRLSTFFHHKIHFVRLSRTGRVMSRFLNEFEVKLFKMKTTYKFTLFATN